MLSRRRGNSPSEGPSNVGSPAGSDANVENGRSSRQAYATQIKNTQQKPEAIDHLRLFLILFGLIVAVPVSASPLFDDDAVLEIRLSGQLAALIKNKKVREEYPFVLGSRGTNIQIKARVRGNSRVAMCRFPPLRLNFASGKTEQTVFAGQKKLKLVTHCKSDNDRAEGNVLDEYTAYRIFNLLSDASYQVRLVRVSYQDADAKQKDLERSYYGFLIESDRELAARLGGEVAAIRDVRYSRLDDDQTTLSFVFQYLIGNTDYSLLTAETEETCCHNVDLIDVDGKLLTVPYDFDFSGLVNAAYAKPNAIVNLKRVTQRRYIGYCKSDIQSVKTSLQRVVALKHEILSVAQSVPALAEKDVATRLRFLERFFEAAGDQEGLLRKFSRECLGPN